MPNLAVSTAAVTAVLAAVAGHAPIARAVLVEHTHPENAPSLNAFGLPFTAEGNASLSRASNGALVISNIGSSGLDGVTYPIGHTRRNSMSIGLESFAALTPGGLVAVAYLVPPLLWLGGVASLAVWLPWLMLPWAVALARRVDREKAGALNEVLAATAQLELAFSALFAVGLVL